MAPSAAQIRRQYIDFFVKKHGHKEIPSASVIPENDPTVLFTTAGMHPLVPFLMGESHPSGKRLVDVQKCVRTDDIDEVGDAAHLTFFEMMGNWSLGDYFKEEAIKMSFELLTLPWEKGGYGLPVERLFISCFEGDSDAPRDTESAGIWERLGIPKERIYFFSKEKNWWGPAGRTGPCGPDTEMFYDTMQGQPFSVHKKTSPPSDAFPPNGHPVFTKGDCHPACDCGRFVEVWNDVFMQYNKVGEGKFEPLKQKNVDTGLGLERLVPILHGKESPFETELFWPAVSKILTLRNLSAEEGKIPAGAEISVRIIADHLRAAMFILGDPRGVSPSNVDQGYIVRRLIRRAIRHFRLIGHDSMGQASLFTHEIAKIYIQIYSGAYPELTENQERILTELNREEERFQKTLEKGLRELKRIIKLKDPMMAYQVDERPRIEAGKNLNIISGRDAFYVFETYGFPLEMIQEELEKEGMDVDVIEFQKAFDGAFKRHQELSRAGADQKFVGGLADHSEQCQMHHTATHLVHQALRDVLGPTVFQKGSNITKERLRFDFSYPAKMTLEQIKKVEEIVNTQIQRDLPVHFEILDVEEAKKRGAIGLFDDKYAALGNKVKVYFMGPSTGSRRAPGSGQEPYSVEVCGGPHVEHTGVLKGFKILKEEACSAGIRRIKAVVLAIVDRIGK